ncbi:unnamed protein product [Schistosoma mattheei]|uniref:Uncharacterized protein n=1 Tax=Schistosoma mattheei TaxID=31246 RepID=A0A183NJU8_9TREM|nr:unnamed protein product [Schistosoma mattheei]
MLGSFETVFFFDGFDLDFLEVISLDLFFCLYFLTIFPLHFTELAVGLSRNSSKREANCSRVPVTSRFKMRRTSRRSQAGRLSKRTHSKMIKQVFPPQQINQYKHTYNH